MEEIIEKAREYVEIEKHSILSLDICKQELEPYYQEFKKLLEVAKG